MSSAPGVLCFLDVDGPLNPYAAKPHRRPLGYTTHRMMPPSWEARQMHKPPARRRPLRVWLNPRHGVALMGLADRCALVWATTWMGEANAFIGPVLGLPILPYVDFGDAADAQARHGGLHWKTKPLLAYAAGRPFIWVDDELADEDRAYVAAHHAGPALLHWIDPRLGLLDSDFAALTAFATAAGPTAAAVIR
ncbi:hypothetical protein [Streptomyces melanogenes]|uniref:hypothetical protein n=1 Tax=Streptomyces melanogenes TaxID=67326 RepID=UPI00378995B4